MMVCLSCFTDTLSESDEDKNTEKVPRSIPFDHTTKLQRPNVAGFKRAIGIGQISQGIGFLLREHSIDSKSWYCGFFSECHTFHYTKSLPKIKLSNNEKKRGRNRNSLELICRPTRTARLCADGPSN